MKWIRRINQLNEYAVLDRKLDTPYPMEVDTPYSAIDQNNGSSYLDLEAKPYKLDVYILRYMKDILSKKGKGSETSKIILNEQCSAVILNKVPPKEKDLGGDLKPTWKCIELANKTTQFPKGIAKNVMVKIDKFVFPVDFLILDMKEDHRIPIIPGGHFCHSTGP
ncbi:hypothetical protein Tco_0248349 [Tanacetum coccineum]